MGRGADNLGARVAGFTIAGLLLLAGAAWAALYLYAGDTVPRHASVEGVSIAGLSPHAAEQRLRDRLAARAGRPLLVTYGDGRTRAVAPGSAGLAIDYPASVAAASGGPWPGLHRIWEVVTGGGDHRAELTVDEARMQATLDDLGQGIETRPVEGTVVFRDGRAVPRLGRPGQVVARSETELLLERRFLHAGSQKIPTQQRAPDTSDAAVRRALVRVGRPAVSGPVTLVLGGHRVVAPPRLLAEGLSFEPEDGELRLRVDGARLLDALTPVMRTVGPDAVDARIVLRRGRPVVVPAKVGVAVDQQVLEDRLPAVLLRRGAHRRLAVPGRTTRPAFTTADARALKVTERVSTFTTRFPYADYRNVNLTRAAALMDGTLLHPGETFSLNDVLGERTRANGFTEGYVVSDGIFTRDLGGGVSQIATTAFNAMLLAGLKDVEHTPPAVHSDRYPQGREVTVAWPSVDLRFTDSTPYGVLVTARVRRSSPGVPGAVTVSTYSTRRWRIGVGAGPRTAVRRPHTRREAGPDCQQVEGVPGFGINVFRTFRALGSGKVLRRERFHTDYVAGDAVRCGPAPKRKRS